MTVHKPPRLKKGDIVAVAAPASPPKSFDKLHKGIHYLEHLGYNVVLGRHVHEKHGYFAGSDSHRVSDINELFSNPRVKAIFTARGGYGSPRILNLLDYNVIRRNPKILVGYSDITALQFAIFARTGLITFSGPMVATEFGGALHGNAEDLFWRCLTSLKPLGTLENPGRRKLTSLSSGNAVGRLLAGNLSVMTALLGTPFFPDAKGSILALEEVEEPPYKIDRMLQHLKLAGIFDQAGAVLLGDFANCKPTNRKNPSLTLSRIVKETFAGFKGPLLGGLHYGHVENSLTLPIGIRTRVNTAKRSVEFLESAVQ